MDNFTQETGDNNPNKSKLIRNILIAILALVVIFGVIYFFYSRNKTTSTENNGATFPTGGNIIDTIKNIGNIDTKPENNVLSEKTKLIELYKGPVSGYTILENERVARVFDRSKGLIFDINLNTGDFKAITEQPILKVHDVTFVGQNSIITRSLGVDNNIKSNLYEFSENSQDGTLKLNSKPIFLSDNILELSKSYNNKYIAFVIKDTKGSNIDLYEVESKKIQRLINLPISEWIPSVDNDGIVYISSKASKHAQSGTYKINNGVLDIIAPAKTAQTSILSPQGTSLISVSIIKDEFISNLKSIKSSTENEGLELDENPYISTITDKCTWNNLETKVFCGVPTNFGLNIPDEWYLGNISYNDNIWQYDLKNKKNSLLIKDSNIDTTELNITGNILFFKNKKDEHLWGYMLENNVDEIPQNETDNNIENQ